MYYIIRKGYIHTKIKSNFKPSQLEYGRNLLAVMSKLLKCNIRECTYTLLCVQTQTRHVRHESWVTHPPRHIDLQDG